MVLLDPAQEPRRRQMEIEVREGRADDALEALVWFWKSDEYLYRHSEFVPLLRSAIRVSARVRAHFEQLRLAAVPGEAQRVPGSDWLTLCEALDEESSVLEWFDARVKRDLSPVAPMSRLRKVLLQRGRPGDLLHMEHQTIEQIFEDLLQDELPEGYREHAADAGRIEAAILWRAYEAGRPEEASAIRDVILRADDSTRMRELLAMPFETLRDLELDGPEIDEPE